MEFETARRSMIDSQLRTSGVNEDFVLARMAAVPREDFVPAASRGIAYIDRSIPLANGRRIAAPLFYGMMLAEAQPQPDDRVLVVDAGSGYLPALLSPMVAAIDTIDPADAESPPRKRKSVSLLLIDGAVEAIPAGLAKSLEDGGRVVTGLIEGGVTRLAVGRKTAGEIALLPIAEIGIPHIAEFDLPKAWSF